MYDADYRESLSQSIRQIIDNNDANMLNTMREAVTERLRHGAGYPDMSADEYAQMIRREGEREIARIITDVVRDHIYDAATGSLPAGLGRTLLSDLLDYGNVALWEDIADGYVPAVADYALAIGDPEAYLY